MRVLEGVHVVDGVIANSYVVEGEGTIIIDCGIPGSGKKIVNYIRSNLDKAGDVNSILLTHAHTDHVGGVKYVKDAFGAAVAIHKDDAPYLVGSIAFKPKGLASRLFSMVYKQPHIKPDMELDDGERVNGFLVVHIPGHTEGSVAFLHSGTKSLFIGDSISTEHGSMSLPPEKFNSDTNLLKESLHRLNKLDFENLFPGHGKPVIGKAKSAVMDFVYKLES